MNPIHICNKEHIWANSIFYYFPELFLSNNNDQIAKGSKSVLHGASSIPYGEAAALRR